MTYSPYCRYKPTDLKLKFENNMKYLIRVQAIMIAGLPIGMETRKNISKENARVYSSKYLADKQRSITRNNTQIEHFCGESVVGLLLTTMLLIN